MVATMSEFCSVAFISDSVLPLAFQTRYQYQHTVSVTVKYRVNILKSYVSVVLDAESQSLRRVVVSETCHS